MSAKNFKKNIRKKIPLLRGGRRKPDGVERKAKALDKHGIIVI